MYSKDHPEQLPLFQLKEKTFLTPRTLARRWSITPEALAQWRWNGRSPRYLKIGKRILYDLEEIEKYESNHVRDNTSQIDPLLPTSVRTGRTKF
jgi:hypothetical protein